MRQRLYHWLHHRYAVAGILSLGLLLVLPSLWAGLLADDYAQLLRLHYPDIAPSSGKPGLFHLFFFANDDAQWRQQQYAWNLLPWWTSEQLYIEFFRPLSELTHWLDNRFLAPHTALMHLHSLAWYVLLLWLLYMLYGRLSQEKTIALMALLLFAVDATHGFTVGWLANRNAVLAAVFVLLSVGCFIRARQHRQRAYLLWAGVFFSAGLLSSESAVSAFFWLFCYLLFLDHDKSARRFLSLIPILLPLVIWLCFYRYYGFGAGGNAAYYLSPLNDGPVYLQQLPLRFFTAVSMQFNLLPWHLLDRYPLAVAGSGAVIFVLLLAFVIHTKNRLAAFALACFSAAVLPASAAMMQERNLLIAGMAGALLLAQILHWSLQQINRRSMVLLATIILIFHLLLSAILMPVMAYAPAVLANSTWRSAMAVPEQWQQQHVIALGAPLFDAAFLVLIRRWQQQPLPAGFINLSTQPGLTVTRQTETDWLIEHPQALLKGEDRLLRDFTREPLRAGDVLQRGGLTITIVQVNGDGIPQAMRIRVPGDTDRWQWVFWHQQRWQTLSLAVGEQRSSRAIIPK